MGVVGCTGVSCSHALQIEQARLLTLNAAHLMDTVGNKAARSQISQIKVVAPRVAERVIDRAMQAHGAMGLSQDTPMAHFWVRRVMLMCVVARWGADRCCCCVAGVGACDSPS